MMRYYIDPAAWSAGTMVLAGEEAHHFLHVLRGKADDTIVVMDGAGRQAVARVVEATRREARLEVLRQRVIPRSAVEITLIQAVPREQKMDVIIQKATELGVGRIVPVIADQGVVRLKPGEDAKKRERWGKIALSAAKQSGAWWIPEIAPVAGLLEVIATLPRYDVWMTCSLELDSQPLREVIATARVNDPKRIAFLVGPEGDLTARERAAARNAGARMVSLGRQVLRSETAALYVLSVLQYEFGDPATDPAGDPATEFL
jgi:16S rRNA (uracil1498-N3)-methyltransferase